MEKYSFNNELLMWKEDGLWVLKDPNSFNVHKLESNLFFILSEIISSTRFEILDLYQMNNIEISESDFDYLIESKILLEDSQTQPSNWIWGRIYKAAFNGYQLDRYEADDQQIIQGLEKKIDTRPAIFREAATSEQITLPEINKNLDIVKIFQKRFSCRVFNKAEKLTLKEISNLLFSGSGLLGKIQLNELEFPHTTSPSPGGLNLVDLMLIVKSSDELEAGYYWYHPDKQSLSMISKLKENFSFTKLSGGQEWYEDASCAIINYLRLDRLAWKYSFPSTINAALVELGHRTQNILLTAAELNLNALVVGLYAIGFYDPSILPSAEEANLNSLTYPCYGAMIGRKAGSGEIFPYERY